MDKAREEAKSLVEPQECEITCLELAWMANAVYDLHDHKFIRQTEPNMTKLKKKGWQVPDEDRCKQQPDYSSDNPNLAMACFVREEDKIMVLAFKGTTVNGITDLNATDLSMDAFSVVLGYDPDEPFLEACEVLGEYQREGYRVMVTGHSLGGYMAEVVATNVGISGVGFAAPGSGHHGGDYKDGESGFQNINFEHDKLGNIMPGVYAHKQWSVYVQDYSKPTLMYDMSDHTHGMDYMVESMSKRTRWTNRNAVDKCSSHYTGYYTSA